MNWWDKVHLGAMSLPRASTVAARIDALHDFLWYMSCFFLALFTVGVVLFAWRYHRSRKGRETAYILGSHVLEAIWTIIPLILMLFVFAWGYRDYLWLRAVPAGKTVEVNVTGRQWLWNFEYANGRKTMNELYLPRGTPVKLIMTSEDVLHSFFLPYMRLKQDVVPGMYTYVSFTPTLVGKSPIYCAEYCGTSHSDMLGTAHTLEPADYEKWLQTGKVSGVVKAAAGDGAGAQGAVAAVSGVAKPLADRGKELFTGKAGCFACHSTDGTKKIGPTLMGIFGKTEELQDGSRVKIDENYLRESLVDPTAKLTKGYPPTMPPFKGVLNDDEISSLVAYIKSLK